MAERIVSPGVFSRETDSSFLTTGVGGSVAAFVGPFKMGPSFSPTLVTSQAEFEQYFGSVDGTYYTEIAVQNYLRENGSALLVKVGGLGGYTQSTPFAIIASSSVNDRRIVATIHNSSLTEDGLSTGFVGASLTPRIESGSFTLTGAFVVSGSSTSSTGSISALSNNYIVDILGTSPMGSRASYIYTNFASTTRGWTESMVVTDDFGNIITDSEGTPLTTTLPSISVSGSTLPHQNFSYDTKTAHTPWIVSQKDDNGLRNRLFRVHTIADGTLANTLVKVSISNVRAAGTDSSTPYASFTLTVRAYEDSDRRKIVYETFNVNLDPTSPNYIGARIGDKYNTLDENGRLVENGTYANRSKYIRVELADPDTYTVSAAPFGHEAYVNPIAVHVNQQSWVAPVRFSKMSFVNTPSASSHFSGFMFGDSDNANYNKPIPTGAVSSSSNMFAFDMGGDYNFEMTGSATVDVVRRQFSVAFQGGFDGMSPLRKITSGADITSSNTQGFDCRLSSSSGSIAYQTALQLLSNVDEYDINLLTTPGLIRSLHNQIVSSAIDLCESRGDCFYIADLVGVNGTVADVVEQASDIDSNYTATYFPWVKTQVSGTNRIVPVPPSVLMPAVFASSDRLSAEWFAPAGLNRGGIPNAIGVSFKLNHTDRDRLYEGKVNPIATFPSQGIVVYGQKTLQDRPSALDRINVRRLLISVKKYISRTARFLVFEQNTATTRNNFLNIVNPYFENIQQRQGLFAFRVIMDESNNTPDTIDRNLLVGQIFLQPTRTAEFIVFDFNILPTGATFSS